VSAKVEFISEKGNVDVISIDCVPSKWIINDEKAHTCVTKFTSPPYSKTRKAKLNNLIATKSDSLEYWPCYPVYLRGEAGK